MMDAIDRFQADFVGGFLYPIIGMILGSFMSFSLSLPIPLWLLPIPLIMLAWSVVSDIEAMSKANVGFALGYLLASYGLGSYWGLAWAVVWIIFCRWLVYRLGND